MRGVCLFDTGCVRRFLAFAVVCAVLGLGAGAAAQSVQGSGRAALPVQYTLTVAVLGPGSGGAFASTSGLSTLHGCSRGCSLAFDSGTTVHLEALPSAPNNHFGGWGGDCSGNAVDPNGYAYCDVVMTRDGSVTVDFELGAPPPFVFPSPPPAPPPPPPPPPPVLPPADLVVQLLSTAPQTPPVGAEVMFLVQVSTNNLGASAAVTVDLTLPANFAVTQTQADRGTGCTGTGQRLHCDLGSITYDMHATYIRVTGKVTKRGEMDATATVASLTQPEPDATLADNTSTLTIPPAARAVGQIVLGSKNFGDRRYEIGWGTAHPRVIYNGGDPSGKVWNIQWSEWGSSDTRGRGVTWVSRPQGGYYTKSGLIELRAFGIGRCSPTGLRAYLHLEVRVQTHPGGPLGNWYAWGGSRSVCPRS